MDNEYGLHEIGCLNNSIVVVLIVFRNHGMQPYETWLRNLAGSRWHMLLLGLDDLCSTVQHPTATHPTLARKRRLADDRWVVSIVSRRRCCMN